jgi:hypothetical protein
VLRIPATGPFVIVMTSVTVKFESDRKMVVTSFENTTPMVYAVKLLTVTFNSALC